MTLDDKQAVLNLFEDCYKESVEGLQKQTVIDSPYPPFEEITYPETCRLLQDMYDGRHWQRMPKMAKWKSRPVKNYPFQIVESQSTFLTDNRPAIAILPREAGDEHIAKLVKAGVDYWWDEQYMDRKMMDVVKGSRIQALGWIHLYWDAEKKKHVSEVLPMWAFKVDPDCTADNYDPTYGIYEFKTTVGEIKSKFPDVDLTQFDPAYRPTDGKLFDETYYGSDTPRALERNGINSLATPTWCYQLWIRDGEADYIEKDIGGGKVAVIKKRKYPKGRVITIAGGVVLEDKPSPFDHGEFPFIPYFAYTVPGRLVGVGDIHNILSSTIYRNRTLQQLYDSIEKSMGALILVNPRLFKGDRLTNEPVQVHEVNDVDNAVRIERMGSLTRHETTLLTVFDKDNDDVGGQHEFSRGETVPGNKTAQEVSLIAESDKTRTRASARSLAWSNKMLARQLVSNMAQWTDYQWLVRIAGDEETEQQTPVPFNGTMMKREDESGKLTGDVIEFDIVTDDYSMLPASQRDQTQLYMQLFGMIPNFPVDEFLKGIGVPNYRGIAKKIADATQQAQQAQMQAQQAQAPPAESPPGGGIPPEMAAMMQAQGAPQQGGVSSSGPPPELIPMLMQMAEQLGLGGAPQQAQPEVAPEVLQALMQAVGSGGRGGM